MALLSGPAVRSDDGMTERGLARPPELGDFWTVLVECHGDLPTLLEVIANRVVDLFGDGCVLTMIGPDGESLEPRAIVHADPVVDGAMRAALAGDAVRFGEGIAGTVAADRRPILLNDLPPQTLAETTPPQFLPFVRDHPMRAVMIAPLLAFGELVGTLGSVRTSSDDQYTRADLRLLEALAERAALAISEAVAGPRAIGATDYEAIYRHNLDGVLLTTPDGHILAANPAACSILGRSEREITLHGRDALVVADDPRLAPALAERAAVGHARAELTMRRGDGSTFIADVSSTLFTAPDGKVRAAVIFRDVSEQVDARRAAMAKVAELEQVADRDPLTGLWNRRGFSVAVEQALATADRQGVVSQLIFVDVDGLKEINDSRGHAAGDAAIRAVAAAIDRTIRDGDDACRFGGDEFVVLLVDTSARDVPMIIRRIGKEIAADPAAPDALGFSTGVVERPPRLEAGLAELIDAADREMYQQKVMNRLRRSR
jgi:diguanylate cyclase (GGDEF)-like protein/PAS domain S-box-containing protein